MLRKFIREYLDFSARERTGVLLLLLFMLMIYAVPYVAPYVLTRPIVDTAAFEREVALFLASCPAKETPPTVKAPPGIKPVMAPFDPNHVSKEDWMKMGIKERTARAISNFTTKGGRFRKPEDLQKIYTLSPEDYQRLLPYVCIAEKRDTIYKKTWEPRRGPEAVDVNAADSAAWEQLPGIGPGFARRIVRFRERLGGFYYPEQVKETYGLPDSVFNKIQPFLRMGSISLRKIDLNQTDEKSLAQHPYINTKLAVQIIRYRSVHGPFRALEELKQLPLVDDIIYRKLENYITIN